MGTWCTLMACLFLPALLWQKVALSWPQLALNARHQQQSWDWLGRNLMRPNFRRKRLTLTRKLWITCGASFIRIRLQRTTDWSTSTGDLWLSAGWLAEQSPVVNKPVRKGLSTFLHTVVLFTVYVEKAMAQCQASSLNMVWALKPGTLIFWTRFVKSRTQCASFPDLLPLPIYWHRLSKRLFG